MRPGQDTALKLRLAQLSGEAMQKLAGAVTRDCADVRVRHALDAAMRNPDLSATARRALLEIAEQLGDAGDGDETRTASLKVRVSPSEMEQIRERAEAEGATLSDYLRRAALGG